MPRVFLIAQPTLSRNGYFPKLEPLSEHGDEVITLIPLGMRLLENPVRSMAICARRLRAHHFNYREDALVWAGGDTLGAVLVGYLLSQLNVPEIIWLKWNRVQNSNGEWVDEGGSYSRRHLVLQDVVTSSLSAENNDDDGTYPDDD